MNDALLLGALYQSGSKYSITLCTPCAPWPYVQDNRRELSRLLKKSVQQGRNERRGDGVRFGTSSF